MTPRASRPARFTRILPLLAVCLPAVGCCPPVGEGGDDGFREGVPTSDAVALKVPAGRSARRASSPCVDGTVGTQERAAG